MPPHRRQRKTHLVSPVRSPIHSPAYSPVCSPVKSTDTNSGLVVPPNSPETPAKSPVDLDITPGPNTPTKGGVAIEQSLSLATSPTDIDTPTIVGVPSEEATPAEAAVMANHKVVPGRAQDDEVEASENSTFVLAIPSDNPGSHKRTEPLDPPDNPFKASSPDKSQAPKANTLREAMQKTSEAAEFRQTTGSPLVWFTTPMGRTGVAILDHALDDLRLSRYCLWMGNPHRILTNCQWVTGQRSSAATLQWKNDAPNKLAHGEGDAIIGFLGTVTLDGLNLAPDAGWQPSWGEEKLHKVKRAFRTVYPGTSSNIQPAWWNTQMDGALRLVDDGCKLSNGGSHEVTHCFVNRRDGQLRARSPLFLSTRTAQDSDEDDQGSTSSEESIPKDFKFETWNISSREVRDAFDRVIQQGYEPQVLEAYTRFNKLIHPNNVAATLSGAIVLVHCTLERMRFSKNNGRDTEFQFYANLVKVQVLKLAPPVKSIAATKRKFVHSYGPNDEFGPDGRLGGGSTSSKRQRLTLREH
ncbi:hypothetical protein FRC08_011307 [Ceratobasidium sp. 394]|nr:hypothetical protein FRC08_011307 [Ceratobasidium sp. 394]